MKNETKQTKIQEHISKTLEHCKGYSVWWWYNIEHAQTTHCSRSCSNMDFRKRSVFVKTMFYILTFLD